MPPSPQPQAARTEDLDFGEALRFCKNGYAIQRKGWNGKGLTVLYQEPTPESKMTLPYLFMEYPLNHPVYPDGCRVPWLASQTDLLANDWCIVTENNN
jgi:hypothetical protein